jgi:hypothetical protein
MVCFQYYTEDVRLKCVRKIRKERNIFFQIFHSFLIAVFLLYTATIHQEKRHHRCHTMLIVT